MSISMTKKAARLGISTSYLSMIYNSKRKPSYKLVQRWRTEALICKPMKWWDEASCSEIQNQIDKV